MPFIIGVLYLILAVYLLSCEGASEQKTRACIGFYSSVIIANMWMIAGYLTN